MDGDDAFGRDKKTHAKHRPHAPVLTSPLASPFASPLPKAQPLEEDEDEEPNPRRSLDSSYD